MKPWLLSIILLPGISLCQCPSGYIPDCNGNCHPASWVGDGICDDGIQYASDFMCAEFNWDAGDCDNCGAGLVGDCNGNCVSVIYIGDGTCHDSGAINFNCQVFGYDAGDCPYPGCTDPEANNYDPDAEFDDGSCNYSNCPPGQFEDCDGNCWPLEYLNYKTNWHCNMSLWYGGGLNDGPVDLNLNCVEFAFDGGDCIVSGCTDPEAQNYYSLANEDDGTCFYGICPPGTMDCMGNCIPENWIGTNACDGISSSPLEHLLHGAYPDQLLGNLATSNNPRGMCVLQDGSRAYVAASNFVNWFDLTSPAFYAQGECNEPSPGGTINVGGLAYSCAGSADNQFVFVANWGLNVVQVINTNTNTIVNSIAVGVNPLKCHLSSNGAFLYVSCNGNNTVYKINASTQTVAHVFNTGSGPRNICTSPDGTKLYVANWSSYTMSVHSTIAPYQLIATVPVDYWPQAIWAQPSGEYVLVANFGFDLTYDHCSVIRTSDWQVIGRLQTGAGPEDVISIGEDGQYLYVSNWGMPCCFGVQSDYCCSSEINKGNITVIALPDFNEIVAPGTIPTEIPYIISTLTTIPVQAEYSFGMAAHPAGEYVFVVNKDTHNMSVVGLSAGNTNLPTGDLCETAIPLLNLQDCITGTNSGFQDNYNESCPFTQAGGRDVVYSYTPDLTISGIFDMCESEIDSKLYIYQDVCGEYNSGDFIYCNDDYCGINGWRSYLNEVTLYSNHTYYIVVDAFGAADCGEFELCFAMTCSSDLNQDGIISVGDILAFAGGYGTLYDSSDLLLFLADFGQVCDP